MNNPFRVPRLAPLLGLAAGLAVLLLVAACGDDDDDGGEVDSGAVGADVPPVQEIVIVASDQLEFSPSTIRVKVGQPVRLVLDNSGAKVLHDFTIDEMHVADMHMEGGTEHMEHEAGGHEPDIHIAAEAGETATLEFTPQEAGEYTFYCTVEGHQMAGMEGTLIVES